MGLNGKTWWDDINLEDVRGFDPLRNDEMIQKENHVL